MRAQGVDHGVGGFAVQNRVGGQVEIPKSVNKRTGIMTYRDQGPLFRPEDEGIWRMAVDDRIDLCMTAIDRAVDRPFRWHGHGACPLAPINATQRETVVRDLVEPHGRATDPIFGAVTAAGRNLSVVKVILPLEIKDMAGRGQPGQDGTVLGGDHGGWRTGRQRRVADCFHDGHQATSG